MTGSCPTCRAPLPPVIDGMPDNETVSAAERGEVLLAGCLPGVAARVTCPRCGSSVELPSERLSDVAGDGLSGHPETAF